MNTTMILWMVAGMVFVLYAIIQFKLGNARLGVMNLVVGATHDAYHPS